MLSNLYQTLDRIKTELVQSRSLTDQTKTLEDKLTSLLAKRPVDLAKLPSELQDLLVDATTVETEWRAYAQASATPAAMLATPLELLQSRYEQFTNYALQNHPRIDLDFIHHLQPAGEIKQADLPNLIAAFNALEQHLDKVEEISQSLDALVAMLPGFKVIENARDRLADQLKRILEVKAPDELNSLSDKLDSLKANIAGEQEKWKDAAASKQAYDAKVATLNNGIAHWQGKNRPDLVDQLRNLYASVRSAQEEFLRLRQAADPAAVAGRFAEDRENLSINARKITADAPIAITEASVQEKYSGRFQEIAGYLQQFESKANGIPAILTAHQAFVRELERIMKPSTFNEFDAIPSRLIQLEKDLSDAVEDMPWQTYLHFEIVRPNYLRNMYGDWIDPVQVILARLKPASDVKAINQAYATLQTELKDILAPQTRDELDKIADRLDQLILKAEAEIKKWEPVLAPRQMYIQGVAKYTREKNTWKDLNRLDVVESLQKAYMDIKDSQHTFLEQSNNPAAISRRYEEDLVKLTNAIDEVIASVDTSKASVPTSGSRQYVEYRDNVIADVKKRVGVLKEMIRTIRDNLPARSPNNSQRDDTLNGILGIVKDYTGDTFAQKKLLRTVTTPVNALSGEDFELYRSEFDAAYREALQKLESIEKTAQFVNSHALYLRVASSLDDRQNLVLKSLTDLAQTPGVYFNYFIQDQILRNREALDRARDTLAASLRNNTGFDALNEECKTFKAAWEAYEASLSQATREGYLPDIMEQLKLEQAHPGTLSDASRTTIIGALENYTNKLISEAEAIMTAQFRVEGDFPELKRYFDERVKQNIASITAQLGDRKEILESLDLEKIDELWKEIHQLYRDNTFKEQLQHKTEELKVILSKNREQREAIATHLKNFRENRQFWLAIDLSQACKEAEEALRDAEDKLKVGNYNAYLQALRSFNTALETGLKSIRALMNKPKSLEDQKTYIETTFKGKFNALEDYKALKRALVGTRSKP